MRDTDNIKALHRLLAEARRERGITQSQLAAQAGCRQSAVSMMERGRTDALAWDKIKTVAQLLDVDVTPYAPEPQDSAAEDTSLHTSASGVGICPIFDCPGNIPFVVNGRLLILPRAAGEAGERHCAYCGELLERTCPECGSPLEKGRACCGKCGAAYIAAPENINGGIHEWAERQRHNIAALGIGSS
jgi:transcriptional regulator with XRE-family HTH domain